MIQRQLKLRLNQTQERTLEAWLWNLTGLWNWALSQVEHAPWRLSKYDLEARIAGHCQRLGIAQEVMKGTLFCAHDAWSRHRRGLAGRPRRKGQRRPLNSIPFPRPVHVEGRRARLPILGFLRFSRQDLPAGAVKCGRIIRRASGWYLCLAIDADRAPIARVSSGAVGIDPGFKSLLILSTGETISHPREFEAGAVRLAQAQRGHRKRLTARLHERMQNQRLDRNHKLSRDLVSRFTEIYFSKDRTSGIAKRFGKSVASSGHSQLRQMLSYKSRAGGAEYVEVDSKLSTKTCSACGALSGPTGLAGLKVRQWTCTACGKAHDRDVNAALNTLIAGAGRAHESKVANAA
jgi:putative transposase